MAEKDQQAGPSTTQEGLARADVESAATAQSKELRRKQRLVWVAYIAAFLVFQTIVLVVFQLTVMRAKSPKYRLRSIAIENLSISNATASPSFNMRFNGEFTIKNKNFGPYEFEDSNVTFSYRGRPVGAAPITNAAAGFLSTKKLRITFNISSNAVSTNSNLGSDIASGMLTMNSYSKLSGKVRLLKVLDRKKSTEMNCTMTVNLADKIVQDLKCH